MLKKQIDAYIDWCKANNLAPNVAQNLNAYVSMLKQARKCSR